MNGNKGRSAEVFDSLDQMMLAYADEAVRAGATYGERLDFTAESIAAVDRCLTAMIAPREPAIKPVTDSPSGSSADSPILPSLDLEHDSRVWGAYLGEVVRRRYGGDWQMNPYPGGNLAVPSLEVQGSHLYPMMKIFRRLTLGESENVSDFYTMLSKRLARPASIQGEPRS